MAKSLMALLKQASSPERSSDGMEETALALASSAAGLRLSSEAGIAWDKPLKSGQMRLKKPSDIQRLKKNLTRLLPQAADWIADAPITPHNTPAAVASLVAAAKRSTAKPQPTPTFAVPALAFPTIMVKGEMAEARTRVANFMGASFAQKASDRFVYRTALRMKTSQGTDVASQPVALVLEFQEGAEPIPPQPAIPLRESGGTEVGNLLEAALRNKSITELRARFYTKVTGFRADIEKRMGSVPLRETGEPVPQQTELCWLNGTMQVLGRPRDVADCAAEPTVQRIGMPRLLEREMDVTVAAIGAVAFQQAHAVDGSGIQVAVIDGECDASHPALAGRVVHKNNLTGENWGVPDVHATTVAGILCSAHLGLGGICPAATILNYKVFTTNAGLQGTDFSAAVAIQSALEDGARVANLSWGLGLGTDGDSREARAVNRAWRLGMVIVKSAGNRGPGPGTLTSPADARDVLVVGAADRAGTAVESYSSRGPNGAHTGPDVVAPGASIAMPLHGLLLSKATGPAGWGTSLSAPHVSGLVALLLHQNPSLKPDDVRQLLRARSQLLGNSAADSQGSGFVKL